MNDSVSVSHLGNFCNKPTKWTQLTRGVSQQTAKTQRSHAISILDSLGSEPELWEVRGIRRFVLARKNQYQASYTKAIGSNLRAFLRFLVVEGLCKSELIDAVPQIAYWRLSDIPRHLQPESVERVIAASGSRPHSELRDRAVILLLSRLGLRARDVVNLCLFDIDWQKGLLRIVGKGRRKTWLPLPQEPGNALLAYLEHERPLSMYKHVFLRCRAPFSPLKGIGTIQIIVHCALKKANVEAPPRVATHLFRHSFAKRLFQLGSRDWRTL